MNRFALCLTSLCVACIQPAPELLAKVAVTSGGSISTSGSSTSGSGSSTGGGSGTASSGAACAPCPAGYTLEVTNGVGASIGLPQDLATVCAPICSTDSDCGDAGRLCLDGGCAALCPEDPAASCPICSAGTASDLTGSYCALSCLAPSDCPAGTACAGNPVFGPGACVASFDGGALAQCNGGSPGIDGGPGCSGCQAGYVEVPAGVGIGCAMACGDGGSCPNGFSCSNGACATTTGPDDYRCPTGMNPSGTYCIEACDRTLACPTGSFCFPLDNTGLCLTSDDAGIAPACNQSTACGDNSHEGCVDTPCPSGQSCVLGSVDACYLQCQSLADCGACQVCSDGICVAFQSL